MELSEKTKTFIEKAKLMHGDATYDYSVTVCKTAYDKVEIICNKHDRFLQLPFNHLKGHGCPSCAFEMLADQKRHTIERFITVANKVHNNKYNYCKSVYKNAYSKILIICPIHNEFYQIVSDHLNGRGCRLCGYKLRADHLRFSNEEFIRRAKEIHGDTYDYRETVYETMHSKVKIICKIHNMFEQIAHCHLQGQGCHICGINKLANSLKLGNEKFIERAKEFHGNEYNYQSINFINMNTPITIICQKHSEFNQIARVHLRGGKCPKCYLCPTCQIWRTMGELCTLCKEMKNEITHRKTKELEVVKFLKDFIPDHEFIHNKSVGKDCTDGHLFPDIRFDCIYYNLIVEVDEHKHRGSGYECDKQRMYDIIAKLGIPCIFIRYNPDSKNSNKDVLLNTIEEYIDLGEDFPEDMFDDYGFKCIYLFY